MVVHSGSEKDLETVNVPYSGWFSICFHMKETCNCVFSVKDTVGANNLLHLPQRVGNESISSLEIGTLIYLEKDSKVKVVRESSCDVHADSVPSFEWNLFLQSEGAREDYSPNKTLICAACCRMFSSIHSVQQHIRSIHPTVNPNSVWQKPLKVVYDDDSLVVIDKSQGMSIMGDKGGPTLCRSDLLFALAGKGKDAMTKPVHVHRLDAPTGGLLVMAKTKVAESALKSSFATRSCHKRYLALVFGRVEPEEGTIEKSIGGKPAVTKYKVAQYCRCKDAMATDGWVTLMDLYPLTGRNHQLRRHMKHIGNPIWGDKRYAPYRKRKGAPDDETTSNLDRAELVHSTTVEQDPHGRLCLWAMEITFPHPDRGKELTVALDDRPEWLTSLLDYQEKLIQQQDHTATSNKG